MFSNTYDYEVNNNFGNKNSAFQIIYTNLLHVLLTIVMKTIHLFEFNLLEHSFCLTAKSVFFFLQYNFIKINSENKRI